LMPNPSPDSQESFRALPLVLLPEKVTVTPVSGSTTEYDVLPAAGAPTAASVRLIVAPHAVVGAAIHPASARADRNLDISSVLSFWRTAEPTATHQCAFRKTDREVRSHNVTHRSWSDLLPPRSLPEYKLARDLPARPPLAQCAAQKA